MVGAGGVGSKDLDVEMATGYVSIMKRTLGDSLTIGLILLVMCTTCARRWWAWGLEPTSQ
jgi:hypothetical protein